jgi:hypothetical protein
MRKNPTNATIIHSQLVEELTLHQTLRPNKEDNGLMLKNFKQ